MHRALAATIAAVVALGVALSADAAARKRPKSEPAKLPGKGECQPLPAAKGAPWQPGERLGFDIDVLGVNAGKLVLLALPTVGKGSSQELPLRSLASSNSAFSKVRRVRGRSTSYVRARDLHPRRYREDSNEDGVIKWAEVVFKRPKDGGIIKIDWQRGKMKGKRNMRYLNEAFDPVSVAYYLRTVDFREGQSICFDAYAIRANWRVVATVKALETVTVPAGTFKAWHLTGRGIRVDNRRSHREMDLWISADEKRLPLAMLGVLDLGAVRAQLVSVGTGTADESEDRLSADTAGPKKAAPSSLPSTEEDEDEDEAAAPTPPAAAPQPPPAPAVATPPPPAPGG